MFNTARERYQGCVTVDGDETNIHLFTVDPTIWQSIKDKTFGASFSPSINFHMVRPIGDSIV